MNRTLSAHLSDGAGRDVRQWLPPGLHETALATGGFQRRPGVRSASDLVRIALAYATGDLSLRSVAAWMSTHGLGEVSDVAVLGRIRRGAGLLGAVLASLVDRQLWSRPVITLPWRVRLVDATTVCGPDATGADWRLHVGYDAARGVVDSVELTDGAGAEHLGRFNTREGDVLVSDRGYAHEARLLKACEVGAHLVVRLPHSNVPLAAK